MNRREDHCVVESLEPRQLFAGLVLEATGRLGPDNTFMPVMAQSIANHFGGLSNVSEYILSVQANQTNGALYATISQVAGTASPATSSSGEVIVLIDYYSISANPSYSTTVIGSTVANYLMNNPVDGVTLASLPIHGIALSRGCGVIDGVAAQLAQNGIWVDQETYLDPDTIGAMGDPAPTVYDNVAFVDNYWRNDGTNSPVGEGDPVNGAYNLNATWLDTNYAGWGSPHEAPTGYYIGTIDQNATQSGLGPIYSNWYGNTATMPARNATGFIYSSVIGAARPASGLWSADGGTGARTAVAASGTQWGNMTDLAVTGGSIASADSTITASFLHEDRGGADSVTFYLDNNTNPYDNSFVANLGTSTLPQANSPTSATQSLNIGNIAGGKNYLCAKITNAQGDVRYAYQALNSPLTVQASGTVSGSVVNDISGVGSQLAGDVGLAGRTVYVDLNNSGQYVSSDPSATTDASGNYTIDNVPANTPVTVREVVPAGFRQTAAPTSPITLSTGQNLTVSPFGTTTLAEVSGQVVLQTGTAVSGGADGFELILTAHGKKTKPVKLIAFSAADGTFTFSNVPSGTKATITLVHRKGFNRLPHSASVYKLALTDAQVVNNLLFSQVPITASGRKK